jgi:protein-tyrosine-phosphatase
LVSGAPDGGSAVEVHVVCRANRGRSPIVAHLLRRAALDRAVEVTVLDAGLYVADSHPPIRRLDELAAGLGLDMTDRQPRSTSFPHLENVALVITFEAALKHDLAQLEPGLVDRLFTQRELLRLSSSRAWQDQRTGWGTAGAGLVRSLHRVRPLVDPGDDDTPDPVRLPRGWGGRRAMSRFVEQLAMDAESTADVLWGPVARPG